MTMMIPKLDYRVAVGNGEHITHVNGAGELVKQPVHEALTTWGREGWELVAAVSISGNRVQYILKKPTDSAAQ